MLNTANIYIDLLNKIKESGGAVPPELIAEVEALDVTVNGDETTEPPTVGLVDIVGDMGDVVEDLDIDINGDDTTEPPTPGLKDRVGDLETTINGDTTTIPETPGLVDRVESLELSVNGDPEAVPPVYGLVSNIGAPKYSDALGLLDGTTTYPAEYTTTSDGYILVSRFITSAPGTQLQIGTTNVITTSANMEYSAGMFPVRSGTVVTFDNLTTSSRAMFVPTI